VTVVPLEEARNAALLAWYSDQQRTLPWRGETDPYLILVSEIMLQQTQASRVIPFYTGFVARFPTIDSLASAVLQDVLDAWNGLGYNTRALRLRETARIIQANGWPTTPEGLSDLPGIGPYTAAALASFAFGAEVPAVDTNLRRVLSRWHGEPLNGAALASAATAALGQPASEWNQAMMDLGATVCLPKGPRCTDCPVKDWCAGPTAYIPPAAQARFEGSARQLRGAIIRTLVSRPATIDHIVRHTGFSQREVEAAIDDLSDEGLVRRAAGETYQIAE
jgi:A/G-specific adenine glycosylase